MSKPIKLTEEMISMAQNEFMEVLRSMKMLEGTVEYTKKFEWEGSDKASLVFTSASYTKMMALVQRFDTEVAWHATAYRDEEDESRFHIKDILVYPQEVTGGTVNTDQTAYQEWLYKLDDDTFNNLRMQGHSHVNFATTPSAVDLAHQDGILSQVDDDDFYIFVIWNKKSERTIRIFDMKNNTLYENEDVSVYVDHENLNIPEFIEEAKSMVKSKAAKPYGGGYSYTSGSKGGSSAYNGYTYCGGSLGASKDNYNFDYISGK